jgi:transcriptional regulator with XRE-family HTH domain
MSSFRLKIDPKQRAVGAWIGDVRVELQRVYDIRRREGVTKNQIAGLLGIHRSVITRRLKGADAMNMRSLAEFVWAIGGRPRFSVELIDQHAPSSNQPLPEVPAAKVLSYGRTTLFPPSDAAVATVQGAWRAG